MRFVSISEAKDHLPALVRRAARESIILTRSGRPCARLEGLDAEDLDEEALYRNPKFLRWLQRAEARSFRGPRVDAQARLKALRSRRAR